MTLSGSATFGNTTLNATTIAPAPIAPRKRTLLPVLTGLFIFSYGLMTMLIVEQGSTIETQRSLIHDLLGDSRELSAVKSKAVRERNSAQGQHAAEVPSNRAPLAQAPLAQAPLSQAPLSQAPLSQAPSSQVAPQHQGQSHGGKAPKPQYQLPPRPASDLADDRRALRTI